MPPRIRTDEQLAKGEWECRPPTGFRAPLRWQPTDESVANPQNQYGISKIAEERVALFLGKRYHIPSVAMRYSIVQGPRQSFYNAYSGACRVFCLALHQGQDPVIYEDGNQVRDFVNIHDVVDANLLVLRDPRADYHMFNVGAGVAVSRLRVRPDRRRRLRAQGTTSPVPSGKYRFGDTRHIFSNVDKLRALGWTPRRTARESVAAYKQWLDDADSIGDILDYCQKQMAKLNVVREVNTP